jgi:hypothetical protein
MPILSIGHFRLQTLQIKENCFGAAMAELISKAKNGIGQAFTP